jgi:hypothetical protein
MFGNPAVTGASDLRATDAARWESELLKRVAEMSANDPLIGAKVGGKELAERIIKAMENERGVHVESLFCASGALAGYACQASLRAKNQAMQLNELAHFTEARTSDGRVFLFGDALNKFLAEHELSVWSLAAGRAQALGCTQFPDIGDIFRHVSESIGNETFGVPRLPPDHPVHELPQTYLERFWPIFSPMIERFCPNADHRPSLVGFAIQELLTQTKDALDASLALQIVMESAIPMSKVKVAWMAGAS